MLYTLTRYLCSTVGLLRFLLSQGWHYLPIRIHKCIDLVVRDLFPALRTSVKLYYSCT